MVKVLFLAANPTGTAKLDLSKEYDEITEKIYAATDGKKFDFEIKHATSTEELPKLLMRHKPAIVHFSSHGTTEGLILENTKHEMELVRPDLLTRLFAIINKDNKIKCVILNACYSEGQAKAISQAVDFVIGMSQPITDKTAIRFAGQFYQALGFKKSILEAFELGRVAAGLSGLHEDDAPKLHQRTETIVIKPRHKLSRKPSINKKDWEDWKVRGDFLKSCEGIKLNDKLIEMITTIALEDYHWINRWNATNLLGRNIVFFPRIKETLQIIMNNDDDHRIRDDATRWIKGMPTMEQLRGQSTEIQDERLASKLLKSKSSSPRTKSSKKKSSKKESINPSTDFKIWLPPIGDFINELDPVHNFSPDGKWNLNLVDNKKNAVYSLLITFDGANFTAKGVTLRNGGETPVMIVNGIFQFYYGTQQRWLRGNAAFEGGTYDFEIVMTILGTLKNGEIYGKTTTGLDVFLFRDN